MRSRYAELAERHQLLSTLSKRWGWPFTHELLTLLSFSYYSFWFWAVIGGLKTPSVCLWSKVYLCISSLLASWGCGEAAELYLGYCVLLGGKLTISVCLQATVLLTCLGCSTVRWATVIFFKGCRTFLFSCFENKEALQETAVTCVHTAKEAGTSHLSEAVTQAVFLGEGTDDGLREHLGSSCLKEALWWEWVSGKVVGCNPYSSLPQELQV